RRNALRRDQDSVGERGREAQRPPLRTTKPQRTRPQVERPRLPHEEVRCRPLPRRPPTPRPRLEPRMTQFGTDWTGQIAKPNDALETCPRALIRFWVEMRPNRPKWPGGRSTKVDNAGGYSGIDPMVSGFGRGASRRLAEASRPEPASGLPNRV